MKKFKVIVEDLTVYGCTVEAEDMDEAQEKFHEKLEQNEFNYFDTCTVFSDTQDYDGYLECEWYEEKDDEKGGEA